MPLLPLFLKSITLGTGGLLLFTAVRQFSAIFLYGPFTLLKVYVFPRSTLHEKTLLETHIEFFRNLNPSNKKKFIYRLLLLRAASTISARPKRTVSFDEECMALAGFVVITFGLRRYIFPDFHRFMLYSGTYRFRGNNTPLMKGHVTRNGWIVYSFPDLLEGWNNPNNRINLGLHEAAHALELQIVRRPGWLSSSELTHYKVLRILLSTWWERSNGVWPEGLRATFRPVGSELFPIVIEHFFEDPIDFKARYPEIFKALVRFLNLSVDNEYE
jgi:Mlc titration factor MtfA (ptsG expression regulator)